MLVSGCLRTTVSGYYCLRDVPREDRNGLSYRYLLGQTLDFGEMNHSALAKEVVLVEDSLLTALTWWREPKVEKSIGKLFGSACR